MHTELSDQIAGSAQVIPVVAFHEVSKWYGNVIGINKLTLSIPAGVTGLLGPNGAGKSTLLQLATGQLFPSQGTVRVLGQTVWNTPSLNKSIGLCPEQDAFYEWMTGRDFVYTSARLAGMSRARARDAAARSIESVGMTRHMNRSVRGYSKGMRQRTKLAQALVHEPQVLFLDEPFTGTDPVARRDLMNIVQKLGDEGKSVLVSSHVLHEVQSLTQNIILLNRGRLVAQGEVRQIRDLIDKHPHQIVLICNSCRKLAGQLLAWEDVEGINVLAGDRGLMVQTRSPDAFYSRLPQLSLQDRTAITEVYSDDDNLEAVFKYLVNS
jgi:ABC-2 type transport system ATP-binding protein